MSEETDAAKLIAYIARAIVTEPDEVEVEEADDGVVELETSEKDRGRVIGRHGRVAKAMRTVLAAAFGNEIGLEILD